MCSVTAREPENQRAGGGGGESGHLVLSVTLKAQRSLNRGEDCVTGSPGAGTLLRAYIL